MVVLYKCVNGWIQTPDAYPGGIDMPKCLIFKSLTEFSTYHEPISPDSGLGACTENPAKAESDTVPRPLVVRGSREVAKRRKKGKHHAHITEPKR